jgi:hypothetical protein
LTARGLNGLHVGNDPAFQLCEVPAICLLTCILRQAGEFGALPVRAKVLHVNEQKGCLCWNKGQITGQCHWAPP